MDIKVAIVEDEDTVARELRRALLSWEQSKIKEYDFLIKHFSNGKTFLDSNEQFDIVFLDIELESKESGLKVAQTMRMNGLQTPIVFLTAHKDKMFFGYKVRALDFLVKPIKQSDINWCMDQIAESLSDRYYLHTGRESFKVPYNSILYFEANLHYVRIVTTDGEVKKKESIKRIKKELPEEFVQCHRSYIVNMTHVVSLNGNKVWLDNGVCIDLGQTYQDNVRVLYLKGLPK